MFSLRLGLLFIATRICCSSFLSICLNDPTLSANTIIVRVSSWTSEKMGMKKESQKTEINGLGQYRHDNHPTINNDKDKRYVKKMFEANNHLQTGMYFDSNHYLNFIHYIYGLNF